MHLEHEIAHKNYKTLRLCFIFLLTALAGFSSETKAQFIEPEVVYSAFEITSPFDLGRVVEYDNYRQAAVTAVNTWCIQRNFTNCVPVRTEMDWEYPLQLSGVSVEFTHSGTPSPTFTNQGLATRVVCPPGATYYFDSVPGRFPYEGYCNISGLSISQAVLTSVVPANPAVAGRPANSFSVTPAVTSTPRNPSDGKKTLSWVCKDPNGAVLANATFEVSSHQATQGSGGHIHNTGRPKGTFSALTGSAGAGGVWNVGYTATEIGGTETFKAKCSVPNFVANPSTWTAYVEIADLVALPESPQLYTLVGQIPNEHIDNHYGTAAFNNALTMFATNFTNQFPGKLVRYNDMSLPYGGLYDYRSTWSRPHASHRWGNDVDIEHDNLDVANIRYIRMIATQFRLRFIPETPDNHTHLRLN